MWSSRGSSEQAREPLAYPPNSNGCPARAVVNLMEKDLLSTHLMCRETRGEWVPVPGFMLKQQQKFSVVGKRLESLSKLEI